MTTDLDWNAQKLRLETRPGSYDDQIVAEQWRSYGQHLSLRDRRVLDIGGHIGSFAALAVTIGATMVTSYEPDPDNFEILERNMAMLPFDHHVRVRNRAIVGEDAPTTIELWRNEDGMNKGLHSTIFHRGRPSVTVQATSLSQAMLESAPSVVKCDIEGGEYALDWTCVFNDHDVDQIAMELHLMGADHRTIQAPRLASQLRAAGFTPIPDPTPAFSSKIWAKCAVWRR